jgi:hypothetical protein
MAATGRRKLTVDRSMFEMAMATDRKWQRVHDVYHGSIGRWKRAVDDRDVTHAYYRFQGRRVVEIGASSCARTE